MRDAVQHTHRDVRVERRVQQVSGARVELRGDCALPNLRANLRAADYHIRVQRDDGAQQEVVVRVQR